MIDIIGLTRPEKDVYYLNIAKVVASRGTCLRRKYGAIIVKNDGGIDRLVSSGYVGAPRKRKNCCDIGYCKREALNIPSGERYELCRSVHAEMNAIISASIADTQGAIMYLVGIENDGHINPNTMPCMLCERIIINAGISQLVVKYGDNDNDYKIIPIETLIDKE